ncbi:MAG: S9 family peptidase, partial [Saprospiraceae bacterium]
MTAGVPTIDELLQLKTARGAVISPDGKFVAYSVSETDWEQDAFVTHLWVAETATGRTWQLTRGKKSASAPAWSPDGQWLAFTSDREGGKNQIFALHPNGGEAVPLTKSETGVQVFDWSPDGAQIAYSAADKRSEDRKKHFGDFEVVRRDYAHSHLWTIGVAEAMRAPVTGSQRTKGADYSLGGFAWSPDGRKIAFSATRNPDLVQGETSDLYVLTLEGNGVKKIVDQPGPDRGAVWSPDGQWIAFSSAMGNPKFFHANSRIAVVGADGGPVRSISDAFDEQPSIVDWKPDGLYFTGLLKTRIQVMRAEPVTGRLTRMSTGPAGGDFTLTKDGRMAAMTIATAEQLGEVHVTEVANWAPRKLTGMTAQVKDWTLPASEVIAWPSRDGTVIEGILSKPAGFDPAKKYPLLCVIHGGPTGIDMPQKVSGSRYYPTDIWAARGALILRVNYRGSAGYGEKFRQLNVRTLGVGDAWDVESGVDSLIAKGWVDEKKIGVMGWSQGGYISAFLTASSTKFAAVSVGAGISNWATYYYNTDITPFTRQYFGNDPATDPAIYQKTSPMTYIQNAKTPTLIQHGELDRRVPIANGYELRQGLEDRGVPVEMIV